jgi:hypothetical protein
MSNKKSKKKATTSKKKLRRQSQRMQYPDLQTKMLKEKPELAGRFIRNRPGEEKMSEVILAYAQPLMDFAENVEEQNKAISMAIICWNASVLGESERSLILAESLAGTEAMEGSGVQEVMEFMLKRKQDCFPSNKRRIVDWIVKDKGDQLHIEVATTLPEGGGGR